jgi:hypothetical protein
VSLSETEHDAGRSQKKSGCDQVQRKKTQDARTVMKMARKLVTPDREAAPV